VGLLGRGGRRRRRGPRSRVVVGSARRRLPSSTSRRSWAPRWRSSALRSSTSWCPSWTSSCPAECRRAHAPQVRRGAKRRRGSAGNTRHRADEPGGRSRNGQPVQRTRIPNHASGGPPGASSFGVSVWNALGEALQPPDPAAVGCGKTLFGARRRRWRRATPSAVFAPAMSVFASPPGCCARHPRRLRDVRLEERRTSTLTPAGAGELAIERLREGHRGLRRCTAPARPAGRRRCDVARARGPAAQPWHEHGSRGRPQRLSTIQRHRDRHRADVAADARVVDDEIDAANSRSTSAAAVDRPRDVARAACASPPSDAAVARAASFTSLVTMRPPRRAISRTAHTEPATRPSRRRAQQEVPWGACRRASRGCQRSERLWACRGDASSHT
jgi:hypothetical protein